MTASSEILAAVEKVYSGAWHCKRAEEEAPGKWFFMLTDSGGTEHTLTGVSSFYASPFLRDMLLHAEVGAHIGESS